MQLDLTALEMVLIHLDERLPWVTSADIANLSYELVSYHGKIIVDTFLDYNRMVHDMTPDASIGKGKFHKNS